MKRSIQLTLVSLLLLIVITMLPTAAQDAPAPVTLTLVGYAVPREAYGEIIPLFQQHWLDTTGQQVQILESYGASGSQSRAVAGGFEADIVGLSIEPDITRLVDAGLITHDWKDNPYQGIVSDSLVVLAVRPDNPKGINDWADIAKEGVEIITPDPATSGGAQWNILAAYGAARRGQVEGFSADDAGATDFLSKLIANVAVFDKDGRESFLTFERGIGDVAITYENEVYAGYLQGAQNLYQIVYPQSTILIENPVALVDVYVDKHGTREVAQAFIDFLWSPEAQQVFAANGFRPVNEAVAATVRVNADVTADDAFKVGDVPVIFPAVADPFTIADEFTSWGDARSTFFGDEGRITQLIASIQGG
ncbi:MAG: sulfate ABC transporter substrate-binding protein [Anaerolineae bacterium]|nr:sulfate ABC transporter substrate-binding protein [Anaerolineae bacterium]